MTEGQVQGRAAVEAWRLLDYSRLEDPYYNMAVEEAVMRAVGEHKAPPTLRLWQNANAVIIGYFQEAAREADLEACRSLGTAVVRRVSGGGAVYHDGGNLNYAVFIPLDDPRVPGDVMESYHLYCSGLIRALAALGLQGEFVPINDICVGGRKVSGTAQARRYGAVLHHGTLLLHLDIPTMGKVLRVTREHLEKKGVTSVTERVATLEQLGRPASLAEAKAALTQGFAEALGVRFAPGGLNAYERDLAERLCEEKYRSDAWNLVGPKDKSGEKQHLG